MEISIILPTYNEKDNIVRLVETIKKLNLEQTFEILIIDDNSPDGTYQFSKDNLHNEKNVKIVLRKNIRGLAFSIKEGIEKSAGEHVIVMDTDFTHDPILIKKMISLRSEYEIISGSRYIPGGSMENQLHGKLSYYYNIMLKFILKTNINDNLGGYFLIKRDLLNKLEFDKIFYGYGEYFFRLLYFSKIKNAKIIEIPALYKQRLYGRSKSNFLAMLFKYFYAAVKLRFFKN